MEPNHQLQRVFFVSHLRNSDRPSFDLAFEIQVLNALGQGMASAYVDQQTSNLEINGLSVPLPVIQAAKKQPIGKGDYVDELGRSAKPF